MRAVSSRPDVAAPSPAGGRLLRHLHLVVATVGLAFAFPVGYLVWGVAGLGGELLDRLAAADVLRPLGNSLLIASTTATACAVIGTGLAWLTTRTDLPGRRLWQLMLALPLVIPSFVGATAMIAAFGPGGLVPWVPRLSGFWGAFAVLTLLSYPYVYLPVAARLSSTSASLEEASRLLGAGSGRTFLQVIVPQARQSISAGTLLVFLYGLSDFGAVSLMRFDTITRAIYSSRLLDRATSLTLGLSVAVLVLGVVAAERALGRPPVASVEVDPVRYTLGRWTVPALLCVALVLAMAFVAPVTVFAGWVVRGSTTVGVGFSGLSDGLGFLARPFVNSATAAVVAGVVAVAVVLPVAYLARRSRGWVSEVTSVMVTSVFALPGLVVALAIVFWAVQAPGPLAALYQSFPLLIAGYVLHFGAQALGASQAAITSVPARLDEAAVVLGASARRRFVTVDLPLVSRGLLAAGGLVLLSTLKELPITLLLAPIGFETLATTIWGAAEDGFFAEVGVTSLVLIALSGCLSWLLILRRSGARR